MQFDKVPLSRIITRQPHRLLPNTSRHTTPQNRPRVQISCTLYTHTGAGSPNIGQAPMTSQPLVESRRIRIADSGTRAHQPKSHLEESCRESVNELCRGLVGWRQEQKRLVAMTMGATNLLTEQRGFHPTKHHFLAVRPKTPHLTVLRHDPAGNEKQSTYSLGAAINCGFCCWIYALLQLLGPTDINQTPYGEALAHWR